MVLLIIVWLLFTVIFTSVGLGGGSTGLALIGMLMFVIFWIVVLAANSSTKEGKNSAKREYHRQKRYENEYGTIKWDSKK